jgi:signal transduction histidine kinase
LHRVSVDHQVTEDQDVIDHLLGFRWSRTATEHRVHSRDEFARQKRLDDIVVGADLQSEHAVGLVGRTRHHDDRDAVTLTDRSHNGESVDPRQSDVQDDDVDIGGQHEQTRLARVGLDDVQPGGLEPRPHHVADLRIVVDDQDRRAGDIVIGVQHGTDASASSDRILTELPLRRPANGPTVLVGNRKLGGRVVVEETAASWGFTLRSAAKRWLASDQLFTLPLDLGFIALTLITIFTRDVVVGFHTIFVLLTLTALMLPFRGFVIRLAIWTSVSVALLVWAIRSLDVPSAELAEIPILTFVLVLIFLVAQSRSQAAAASAAMTAELQHRTDLEQADLRQQLEQSQRRELLGRASAGLAHDLRNIFAVVRGSIAEVLDGADAEQTAGTATSTMANVRKLHDVDSAAERGLSIVDELLWLGRQHDSIMEVTDLNAATRQLEPLLRRLTSRGVTLRLDVPHDVCMARIDRIGLSQILMNLVSNANDAITGSGTITVSTKRSFTPVGADRHVTSVLTVADTGCGFTPEALAAAFDDGVTTKDDTHYGLGLPTVWRIVDRCGGSMQIDSSSGTGTNVSIGFESPTDEECPAVGHPSEPATTTHRSEAPTIIDDERHPVGSRSDSRSVGDHHRL